MILRTLLDFDDFEDDAGFFLILRMVVDFDGLDFDSLNVN